MLKRPLSVTLIACVYIAMGVIGFAYHFSELSEGNAFQFDVLGIETVRLLAIVSGVFMLRGLNWARWLALAWIGFHVGVSALHAWPQLAIHGIFFVVIAWSLFHPGATRYFRGLAPLPAATRDNQ